MDPHSLQGYNWWTDGLVLPGSSPHLPLLSATLFPISDLAPALFGVGPLVVGCSSMLLFQVYPSILVSPVKATTPKQPLSSSPMCVSHNINLYSE